MQLSLTNNLDTSKEKYLKVAEGKTASLFSAASVIGRHNYQTKTRCVENLSLFGKYLGIAFQILDDVLDYDLSSNNFGKKIGDDFKEGKVTVPVLIAYKKSNNKEKAFWKKSNRGLIKKKMTLKKA